MNYSRVTPLWRDRKISQRYRTGVSLHSHTMHSRENLAFIPRYASRIPLLNRELGRLAGVYRARTGRELDYSRGHFEPPLAARAAFELESRNIENTLGTQALVSLSDHDDVEAGYELRAQGFNDFPISVEWTVPTDSTHFHVGVHNLPGGEARAIQKAMAECTATGSERQRREILDFVGGLSGTLVVLNHPLWDQSGIGRERHREALTWLVGQVSGSIHALEVNGLRGWPENRLVVELARATGLAVVSGGDRHGCHANVAANLTDAESFTEFAAEVRDGRSEVVFLDEYRVSIGVRIFWGVGDIMGFYPELGDRARWSDRVYVQRFSGETVRLSQIWNGELPRVIGCFDSVMKVARSRGVQRLLGSWFSSGEAEFAEGAPGGRAGLAASQGAGCAVRTCRSQSLTSGCDG